MAEQAATAAVAKSQPAQPGFELPPLPYGFADLQPHLSEETLRIHYSRHHAKYVENLNRLAAGSPGQGLEELLRSAFRADEKALFNNAAQTWNHSFFWESMTPQASRPGDELAQAITAAFGGFEQLRERFLAEGTGHFGSGWTWIVAGKGGLEVLSTHDADTPAVDAAVVPLLTCDVWEHAYYVDYRQDRAKWLATWWDNLANWRLAERQFEAALGRGKPWRFPASE